jgi:hypothetical protein
MNYEDFSLEAQKVIDDFRNLIENIKSRKDESKIRYYQNHFPIKNTTMTVYVTHPGLTKINEAIYAYCFVSRLSSDESLKIQCFLKEKNYFLPKFSYEDYQQNKHKYPYIKE